MVLREQNAIGKLAEECVFDRYIGWQSDFRFIFAPSLALLRLGITPSSCHAQAYVDFAFAKDDDITGDSQWEFAQVKASCCDKCYKGMFWFHCTKDQMAKYVRFAMAVYSVKGDIVPNSVQCLIYLVTDDGMFVADVLEVAKAASWAGDICHVSGVFDLVQSDRPDIDDRQVLREECIALRAIYRRNAKIRAR
jgi:hypothetical protein